MDADTAQKLGSWNSNSEQWREFWKSTRVQAAPVPHMSGRLLQIITFGNGVLCGFECFGVSSLPGRRLR